MKKRDSSSNKFVEETIAARVPIGEMVVDNYQGHVNTGLVDKIAKQWDESAAGAIVLNLRKDGKYAVLDGQHRMLAAQKAGVYELNALCFVEKTHEEEAKLFVQLNTKHNVSAVDRFNANLIAGALREKNISYLLKEFGMKIGTFSKGLHDIRCVTKLEQLYDNFGLEHLRSCCNP